MPAARLDVETEFIRGFAELYFSSIAFSPSAERDMRDQGINLAEVNQALRTGEVVSSDKEDAEGANWIVEGETCDEELLTIRMIVFVDRYHLRIERISKSGEE